MDSMFDNHKPYILVEISDNGSKNSIIMNIETFNKSKKK